MKRYGILERGKMVAVQTDRCWDSLFPGASVPEITWWFISPTHRQVVSTVYVTCDKTGDVAMLANVSVN